MESAAASTQSLSQQVVGNQTAKAVVLRAQLSWKMLHGFIEGTYKHKFTGDRYVMPDGTLSGSCLTMLKAVQNGVELAGITLAEAINMASLYPAQLASLERKGKIVAGFDADLIVFNNAFEVQGTVFKGNYLTKSA